MDLSEIAKLVAKSLKEATMPVDKAASARLDMLYRLGELRTLVEYHVWGDQHKDALFALDMVQKTSEMVSRMDVSAFAQTDLRLISKSLNSNQRTLDLAKKHLLGE
jgi:hypothetical protein